MPGVLVSVAAAKAVGLAVAAVLVVIGALLGYRAWRDSRVSPEERERRRREALVAHGKMGDASLVEMREDLLFYSYLVRGVEYTASQNLASLREYMPPDLSVIAAVSIRYDARNPANSIVLAEKWSGLHTGRTVAPQVSPHLAG